MKIKDKEMKILKRVYLFEAHKKHIFINFSNMDSITELNNKKTFGPKKLISGKVEMSLSNLRRYPKYDREFNKKNFMPSPLRSILRIFYNKGVINNKLVNRIFKKYFSECHEKNRLSQKIYQYWMKANKAKIFSIPEIKCSIIESKWMDLMMKNNKLNLSKLQDIISHNLQMVV
ncbi:MAG: hypothetical protein QXY45_01285 [Candidatus Aenigmatarchaeota archaeon]